MYSTIEDIFSVATLSFWLMLFLKSVIWLFVDFDSSYYQEYTVFNCICAQGNTVSVVVLFVLYANSANLPSWLSLLFFIATICDSFPFIVYIAKLFDDYARPFIFIFTFTNILTSVGSLLLYCYILNEAQKNLEDDSDKYQVFYRITSIHLSIRIVHYMIAFVYSILSNDCPSWMSQWRRRIRNLR